MPSRKFLFILLLTALLTGFLDGLAAVINYSINGGKNPGIVFKFIASGVFGKQALSSGPVMIIWGIIFHFMIAFLFTLFFFILYPKMRWLGDNIVLTGALYGICVWAVMNLIVVPLSNTPPVVFKFSKAIIAVLILIVCIGMPVTIMARKYYLYKK